MRQLPPLAALRAFEAAARLRSFKRAATELNVTQSAISHQVRVLEDHLNILLFRRVHSGVELTPQAEHLLPVASTSFDRIARAVREVRDNKTTLTIYCSSSFALRWLLRRIVDFERVYPDINVQLSSFSPLIERHDELYDIEIVYLRDPEKPTSASTVELIREWLLPVCSPEYLGGVPLPASKVTERRLLINSPDKWDWQCWSRAAGIDHAAMLQALERGVVFDADAAAIETATAGRGIALANLCYARGELDSGTLVPATDTDPFPLGAHAMIQHSANNYAVKTFSKWLLERAGETCDDLKRTFAVS